METMTFASQRSVLLLTFCVSLMQGCSGNPVESRVHQTSQVPESQSYTDAIKELADEAKMVVDFGMNEFNENTLPHEAKELRKQIVRLRDLLDVFPHNFAHELKLWDDVREGLDDGYTVIGDYKDLFDANPEARQNLDKGKEPRYANTKKLTDRRKAVLKWKSDYFMFGGLREQIDLLFADIRELDTSSTKNSKKYSAFFWGGVSTQPLTLATPAENARRLIDAQAAMAIQEHSDVLGINDPSTEKNELLFHDHRKRLRTISKVCSVANALNDGTCDSAPLRKIDSLVVDLGDIEDLIITGRNFEDEGRKKKAKDAYEDAQKKFKRLKNKFEGKDMLEPLRHI